MSENKKNIEIIKMLQQHLDDVVELEKATSKCPWSKQSFLNEIANPISNNFVMLLQNKIIGYYGFQKVLEEAYINNIAITTAFQGKGYGKILLEHLLTTCKNLNIKAVTLEVRVSNNVAISLYQKYNFINAGKRKSFYPDGEDAYIFWYYGGDENIKLS
ncbi:MAG: ribosomal protein S18-alanine N-acetyltransferase [Clostridia bacterium]